MDPAEHAVRRHRGIKGHTCSLLQGNLHYVYPCVHVGTWPELFA